MNKTIRNTIAAAAVAASMLIGSAPTLRAQDTQPADPTPDAIIQALSEGANQQHTKLVAVKIAVPADVAVLRQWIAKQADTTEDKVIAFDTAVFVDEDSASTAYVVFWSAGKITGSGAITKEQFKAVQGMFGTQQDQTNL